MDWYGSGGGTFGPKCVTDVLLVCFLLRISADSRSDLLGQPGSSRGQRLARLSRLMVTGGCQHTWLPALAASNGAMAQTGVCYPPES